MHLEQVYKEWINGKYIVGLEYMTLYVILTVIYCYLERESCKILKFYKSNFFYFQTIPFNKF